MAGGGVALEGLPEYMEFDTAYRMAESLEKLSRLFENGSESGNQNLLSQMNAWTEVIRLIDVLLTKEILAKEKESLGEIKKELQGKLEPIAYKVRIRGIVKKNEPPLDPANFPRVPVEMPPGVPETPEQIQEMVKKTIMGLILPPGKTKEEEQAAVKQIQSNFINIFLTDWTNTPGHIAGKWKIPFTKDKEWLEYFKDVFENNLTKGIFAEMPPTDFRRNALKVLALTARLKFLQASGGGRRRKTHRRRGKKQTKKRT